MRILLAVSLVLACVGANATATLVPEQVIRLPGVKGRIDHLSIDPAGHRLFIAALGNGSVEVVDLVGGKAGGSITGLDEPQGVFFCPDNHQLYVASGGDGALHVYDGATLEPTTVVKFDGDADNVRYDRAARRIYVGHGSGALGAVDISNNQIVADLALSGHPESFQLESAGPRIFVNVPGAHQVAVVDRAKQSTVAKWSLGFTAANFPMALDEQNHRVFIGCRMPARLIVFDTETGKQVAKLELHGDCDDLFFDAPRRQIYATCGEGFIDVFAQADADHYALKEAIPTAAKARTGFFDSDHVYLAVPKRSDGEAEIRCYRISK